MRGVAALAILAAAARAVAAQPSALDTAEVRRAFEAELAELRAPGGTLVVVRGGRTIMALAAGVRSVETRDPMTVETLFRIGSITKTVTGATAAAEEANGRLRLDAPIGRIVPELHPALRSLTMAQLLSHTAGLANAGAGNGLHDDAALGARVRGWKGEMAFARPGEVYSYSSPGYWLAGYVLERRAGKPYADLVAERLLVPLGMRRSTLRPLVALTHPLALDHRRSGDSVSVVRPFPDDVATWPSGSLFSSAEELARLGTALVSRGMVDGEQVLPARVSELLLTPRAPQPGGGCSYSLGLALCTRGGVTVASHYGFRGGTGAVLSLVPERQLVIVALSNVGGGILRKTEEAALRALGGLPADSSAPAAGERVAGLDGRFVNGPDTLVIRGVAGALRYEYGRDSHPARVTDRGTLEVLDGTGAVAQEFLVVRGRRSGDLFLHDGLQAFRRIGP